MASVTQRIKQVKQPKGGYINPRALAENQLYSNIELHSVENIHASLVGLCVDYLSRYLSGASKEEAFKISLTGASLIGETNYSNNLLSKLDQLTDESIESACKLVGYDVVYRAGMMYYKPVKAIKPDKETIENIKEMVNRSLIFFKSYGPVVLDGFTLEGSYTDVIEIGDGDFITKDTLWDFKVSIKPPTKNHTLQLLIYYLMGLRSFQKDIFNELKYLGIFNPRLNKVYTISIKDINLNIIEEVLTEVIGYK